MVNDREAIVDIESNRSECQEHSRNEHVTGGKRVENMLRSLGLPLSFKGLDDGENSSDSNRNHDIESLVNDKLEGGKRENMPLIGKTQSKEKQKVKNSKRASKPPRPRKGPSLSTSDLRLVKEISELVMKKRARAERLKSLKKARSARLLTAAAAPSSSAASSYMSLFAMMITVLFLIVIIFQGFGSRTTGLVAGQFDSKVPK
ncbi:hypothetical protein M8C21_017659 [Ambrosia artemisiifolia]|uniref:Transmembrane protein n=1 Tax=Ambrosia artemisiifolia TaxID=4212 RepID=A0AAD5G754_AMBAR|nr:hypothetical protein M8C21_017659 [Ambrosia artemisiifolia]